MEQKQKTILQSLNLFGYIGVVVINMLANALPINGKNTGELSDNIPNLFVPVGLTFSIWGVIYFLLFLFTWYQGRDLLKKQKEEIPVLDKIGYIFFINTVANIGWILAWHYELVPLSLGIMLVILVTLLLLHLKLKIGVSGKDSDPKERWFIHLPISVYLGWITVATIANVTAVIVVGRPVGSEEWLGLSDAVWTMLVIIVGALITALMLLLRKDIAFSLVVIWAYLGIIIKRLEPAWTPQPGIVITGVISIIVIAALIGLTAFRILKKR